jgi:uncharacterized membrane protein YbaN (DUF454 family)
VLDWILTGLLLNITNKFMNLKKILWFSLGMICLGIAYIGIIVPGIPWSTPSFLAMLCFAKSSDRWYNYLMNHKVFGPFLKQWKEKKVYPTKVKWIMFVSMVVSLIILILTTQNWKLCLIVAFIMFLCMLWAIRYPGSEEEYERRVQSGEKIGWFK